MTEGRLCECDAGGGPAPWSVFEQLLLLVGQGSVDLRLGGLGDLVELLLGPAELVFGELSVLLEALELLATGPAQVAHGDPTVFGHALDDPHVLLAALRG